MITKKYHLITPDMRNLNIRIHRDITGEMWVEANSILKIFDFSQKYL